ncbi:MAG: hypothetical protein OXG78_02775 [Chloroflexi bacterium]|nr:hypothetical protein [Chloroflexota bacterium]
MQSIRPDGQMAEKKVFLRTQNRHSRARPGKSRGSHEKLSQIPTFMKDMIEKNIPSIDNALPGPGSLPLHRVIAGLQRASLAAPRPCGRQNLPADCDNYRKSRRNQSPAKEIKFSEGGTRADEKGD